MGLELHKYLYIGLEMLMEENSQYVEISDMGEKWKERGKELDQAWQAGLV